MAWGIGRRGGRTKQTWQQHMCCHPTPRALALASLCRWEKSARAPKQLTLPRNAGPLLWPRTEITSIRPEESGPRSLEFRVLGWLKIIKVGGGGSASWHVATSCRWVVSLSSVVATATVSFASSVGCGASQRIRSHPHRANYRDEK